MEEKKKRKKLYKDRIKKDFKTKVVKARVSFEELALIKIKAAEVDLTVSDFIRKRALGKEGSSFNPKALIDHFFAYTGSINKVGVNINQATNYINYLKNQGRADAKEIIEFNKLFHTYLQLMTELNLIMKRELKKIG